MKDSITDSIRRHGFKRLLLAVSGGLDSICLAHYFICNKEALGIEWLGIAHVHHGLREGTADRDAAFVEAFARKYGVPFFLKKLDGVVLKNAEGSLEENARDARYKALIDVTLEAPSDYRVNGSYRSRSSLQDDRLQDDTPHTSSIIHHQSSIIVTAHHAGDQAETMYMRLRRGTTLAGLRGIQEIRVLGNSQGVAGLASEAPLEGVMEDRAAGCNQGETSPLIINHPSSIINHQSLHSPHFIYRPFLNVTRGELLAYARENSLEWCEDESNADVKFARNFIRHKALPHLEDTYPGATKQLCRMAKLADRAYAKVLEKCGNLFAGAMSGESNSEDGMTSAITLDKKKLRKVFLAHADADLSEMFRLWLSEQGLRFPIGFFYSPKEPAHVKIPVRAAYRKRSIAKIGRTVRICEFSTPEEAQKFVSCE
ncbi:MAG: tRNA lysidine(34) synthetase TilS [Fibrobacter sp.]|nr:tRNA lysidine(34) synthetase TilS [Fibrobacter sp.]